MEIKLNDKEKAFLKQYARVFRSERDKDWTADPIVLAQTQKKRYVDPDINCDGEEYKLTVNGCDLTEGGLFNKFEEVIETIKEELQSAKVSSETIDEIVNEANLEIFGFYGNGEWEYCGEDVEISIKAYYYEYYYETVAYFFTRLEARKYLKYQGHNLNNPRIFTAHAGYSNKGDFPVFQKLLLKIGEELIKDEES